MTQVNVRICCCVVVLLCGRVVSSSVWQITYDSYQHISVVCVCVDTIDATRHHKCFRGEKKKKKLLNYLIYTFAFRLKSKFLI